MTLHDYFSLSPLLFLLAGSLIILFIESFFTSISSKLSPWISLTSMLAAALSLVYAPRSDASLLTPWIEQDSFYKIASMLSLGIGIATLFLSDLVFKQFKRGRGEFDVLLLTSLMGLILVALSADFLTLFLGLETLSLSLYVLVGYMKDWERSSEASIKYLLLGALGASFLVYGIALLYGAIGTSHFATLSKSYQTLSGMQSISLFWGGVIFVTVGLCFKAAAVPFQFWAPDVYEGACTPVTAFMSVGVKSGAFFAFARVFLLSFNGFHPLWNEGIALIAVITLIFGNLVALRQLNLRRLFAYSGISHTGFLLVAVASPGPSAVPALLFYLIVYAAATLGAFAVICFLDKNEGGVYIHDLKGLSSAHPYLAFLFAFSILTLAGLPPTAGFFAKFYLFKTALEAGQLWLVILALLSTAIASVYYLRLVAAAYTPSVQGQELLSSRKLMFGAACFGLLLFILSLYPDAGFLG